MAAIRGAGRFRPRRFHFGIGCRRRDLLAVSGRDFWAAAKLSRGARACLVDAGVRVMAQACRCETSRAALKKQCLGMLSHELTHDA